MTNVSASQVCNACGSSGAGNYCSNCGQAYRIKRITLGALLHDIFHLFTHLDKGFGYSLKQLIVAPGAMQRAYINGERSRHQKPFSMFFICATVTALSRYWIFRALEMYYKVGNSSEANFFHEYMVLVHVALMPVFILLIYLFFYKSGYNYAEIGVLALYTFSFFLLLASFIALLKFIWPHLDTAYIELPILLIYNAITFVNFFTTQPRWVVACKSLITLTIGFLLVQYAEDFVIRLVP